MLFIFFSKPITFNYPEVIDFSNPEHREKRYYYKQLFENFQYTLPCKYCRESYKEFLRDDPIDPNLSSRKALTFWFYRIHNRVNDKLRTQERELFDKRCKKINRGWSDFQQLMERRRIAQQVFFTPPNPPYEKVCQFYERQRASCSADANKIKSCRI